MLNKIKLIVSTIRHLRPIQIYFQIRYRLIKPRSLDSFEGEIDLSSLKYVYFLRDEPVSNTYFGANKFCFLNIEHDFGKRINWVEHQYGKLWNYNLQYCNWLLQSNISVLERISILRSLYKSLSSGELELEPYPVSLRIINVIRFVSKNNISDEEILKFLFLELEFLNNRLEFHILGNHLLENAFALALGGEFFNKRTWQERGVDLIRKELNEQILSDGGHFELSPMYHNIILFRVLEFINWYQNSIKVDSKILTEIKNIGEIMMGWINQIKFRNGDIPHFNDSANGIAFETSWLINYGIELGLRINEIPLKESGYRAVTNGNYECKIDFAEVGAKYQPGHAHADALSFILYYKKNPLIVEQGTSTYQIGERRDLERSTNAHNTVELFGKNQSQVWGGFRVGDRAKVHLERDNINFFSASHDGYKTFGVVHNRTFEFFDQKVVIRDSLSKVSEGKSFLHFFPGTDVILSSDNILINNELEISVNGSTNIFLEDYKYSDGFNHYKAAKRIVIQFEKEITINLSFLEQQ